MKHTLIALSAALSIASAAQAGARPFTPAMSCDAAAGLVASNGAVLLNTSPTTFDRFVRGYGYCAYGEYLERAFVQTRDAPACLIGFTCTSREPFPRFGNGGGF
jgi:hypothetical protein